MQIGRGRWKGKYKVWKWEVWNNYMIPEDRKCKYYKHKYEVARMENVSMENASTSPQRLKMQVRKI